MSQTSSADPMPLEPLQIQRAVAFHIIIRGKQLHVASSSHRRHYNTEYARMEKLFADIGNAGLRQGRCKCSSDVVDGVKAVAQPLHLADEVVQGLPVALVAGMKQSRWRRCDNDPSSSAALPALGDVAAVIIIRMAPEIGAVAQVADHLERPFAACLRAGSGRSSASAPRRPPDRSSPPG